MPAGAVPKDGPSAGVAMVTALASLYAETPGPQRHRHDRRNHPDRAGAAHRRRQGEGAGGPPGRHPAGDPAEGQRERLARFAGARSRGNDVCVRGANRGGAGGGVAGPGGTANRDTGRSEFRVKPRLCDPFRDLAIKPIKQPVPLISSSARTAIRHPVAIPHSWATGIAPRPPYRPFCNLAVEIGSHLRPFAHLKVASTRRRRGLLLGGVHQQHFQGSQPPVSL